MDEESREIPKAEFIQMLVNAGWPQKEAEEEWEAIQRGERDD